jgi:uncharacterized protein (DUF1697 family)
VPIARRVAFIRAVMIGRDGLHREVLLDLFREAGAIEPRNHLTTGNVSFAARGEEVPRIVEHVERGIEAVTGRPKPLYVRALDHLERLTRRGPPADRPHGDGRTLELIMLPVDAPEVELPLASRTGRTTVFATTGSELWAATVPDEAPGGFVERALGVPVTVRAWSTIQKIVAAH